VRFAVPKIDCSHYAMASGGERNYGAPASRRNVARNTQFPA
jgi:hypothetical protein